MAREAIVEIAVMAGRGLGARLLQSATNHPNALEYMPIDLDMGAMPGLDTSANVEAYGIRLRKALASHTAIESELTQIFGTPASQTAILQFLIANADAERMRWETLCLSPPTQFLALNGVCTVSRIAHSSVPADPGMRAFTFPLRMAALLSAAGIKAEQEFKEICASVALAKSNGLEIECTAYLGEQELLDSAQTDIDAGKLPGMAVAPMPRSSLEIEDALKNRLVEFLHFFCHGVSEAGIQHLELATISDHDAEKPVGSIRLSIDRLSQALVTTGRTWVTVLNSCSGGRPVEQLHSMAMELAKSASPFVVGMAEPLDSADAPLFTNAFYSEMFDIVFKKLAALAVGNSVTLDLAPAVIRGRKAFHTRYETAPADAFGRWCVPLIYRRNAPLQVLRVNEDIKRRIEVVAGALRNLPDDTPLDLRQQILATLDKSNVPLALRPDAFGVFKTA
jgi:hypothetical protein